MAKLKDLIRGDAFTLTIPVKNADGTPFDFTGYKVFLIVKESVDEAGEMTADDTDAIMQVVLNSVSNPGGFLVRARASVSPDHLIPKSCCTAAPYLDIA